jgi:hypothetical protein
MNSTTRVRKKEIVGYTRDDGFGNHALVAVLLPRKPRRENQVERIQFRRGHGVSCVERVCGARSDSDEELTRERY